MSLRRELFYAQKSINDAYILAVRCGRVERDGADSLARQEFTNIATKLKKYVELHVHSALMEEQKELDLARLNGKVLNRITDQAG